MFSRVSRHSIRNILTAIFVFLTFFIAQANEPAATEAEGHTEATAEHEENFDIIGHVLDAHDWHVAGHFSIPLPCIVYTPEFGLEVFMSSKFEPEHGEIRHYSHFELNKNTIHLVDENTHEIKEDATLYDLSITKVTLSVFIGAFLVLVIFLTVAKGYRKREGKAPKGLQSFMEPLIIFVRDDVARPSIGKKYEKFMPLLLTIFFFIFIVNLLGLVPFFPGGINTTGNISIPLFFAALVLIIVAVIANKHYWQHILAMPGVPVWVLFLLTPIEILGFFIRPFVLMVRLFANITAGHIIALAFYSLIFIFGQKSIGAGYGVSVMSIVFAVFMSLLELLVAFLQAFVFTLLTAIYIGSAIEEPHHH